MLSLGVLSSVLLVGCAESEENYIYFKSTKNIETDYGYETVIRDPDTGCMYFHGTNTPYYDKEGKVAGCGKVK